jgi:hypothetical protein
MWRSRDQIWIEALVEDADAIRMIESGTLSRLSIAGRYVEREPQPDGSTRITVDPSELSLVDLGCNFGAKITDIKSAYAGFELVKSDGRTRVVRAKPCGCEACKTRVKKYSGDEDGIEEDEDQIAFDTTMWTRERAAEWLQQEGFDALESDLIEEPGELVYEKSLKGEKAMGAADHSHLAKLHRELAGFHKAAGDTCHKIAAYHEKMGGHGDQSSTYADAQSSGASGTRNLRGFGDVTQDFTHAAKSFYDPTPPELAGGLTKL